MLQWDRTVCSKHTQIILGWNSECNRKCMYDHFKRKDNVYLDLYLLRLNSHFCSLKKQPSQFTIANCIKQFPSWCNGQKACGVGHVPCHIWCCVCEPYVVKKCVAVASHCFSIPRCFKLKFQLTPHCLPSLRNPWFATKLNCPISVGCNKSLEPTQILILRTIVGNTEFQPTPNL